MGRDFSVPVFLGFPVIGPHAAADDIDRDGIAVIPGTVRCGHGAEQAEDCRDADEFSELHCLCFPLLIFCWDCSAGF